MMAGQYFFDYFGLRDILRECFGGIIQVYNKSLSFIDILQAMSGQQRNKSKPTHLPEIVQNNSKLSTNSQSSERYKIGRFLGSGGFAFCYQATELTTKKQYAIKVVNKTSQNMLKNGAKQRLRNQIDLMKKLKHENIIKLISKFQDEHNHYLVIEICNKLSLSELLKRKSRMIQLEVKYYIRQLAMAVLYLKEMHILHRDIKTPNILLDDNMVVKLADFGLAISADVTNPRSYGCCGTPSYMAPEVIREQREPYKRYSYEVDMWSIGVVTFVLLFSAHPFFSTQPKLLQKNPYNQKAQQKKTYQNIKNIRYSFPVLTRNSISAAAKDFIRKIFVLDPQSRLSVEEALSHDFLTQSIPAKMPCQFYGRELRNCDLVEFCRNQNPPMFQVSRNKQIKTSRTITSYFTNMAAESLEKKMMFKTAKKTKASKSTQHKTQPNKQQKGKAINENPFSIKIASSVPINPPEPQLELQPYQQPQLQPQSQLKPQQQPQPEPKPDPQPSSPQPHPNHSSQTPKTSLNHIYQQQKPSQLFPNPQLTQLDGIQVHEWLEEKLKNIPYVYQFRDMSQKCGLCYQLSNGVKVMLFNDKTTMAMSQLNRVVAYVEPIRRKLEECDRLLYKLVAGEGISTTPKFVAIKPINLTNPTQPKQNLSAQTHQKLQQNYKVTQFPVHDPPNNPTIIKKYFFFKDICRTFSTPPHPPSNHNPNFNLPLTYYTTMIRKWGCMKKCQQYIFMGRDYVQVMFRDGTRYFINKGSYMMFMGNEDRGVVREYSLPLRNRDKLGKKEEMQIQVVGKLLAFFIKGKKEGLNGVF